MLSPKRRRLHAGDAKTSLVPALGAKFVMSIYVVNLTELNDRFLKTTMNDVPGDSVILFKDFDCMKAGNRRPESNDWREKQPPSIVAEKTDHPFGFADTLRIAQRTRRFSCVGSGLCFEDPGRGGTFRQDRYSPTLLKQQFSLTDIE